MADPVEELAAAVLEGKGLPLVRALAEVPEERKLELIERLREVINAASPLRAQPVDRVRWVPLDMVTPNDYNPNSVAKVEMSLLHTSIRHDGYTQPVVTIWDPQAQKYVIVDGFHRYYTMKVSRDIFDATGGLIPIVVIEKDINDRMASTVRHNRARGKHSVQGMSSMVFAMLQNGWSDEEICNELGMSPEELLRLKHITGFSKLFKDVEYRKAWMTERQIRIARLHGTLPGGNGSAGRPSGGGTDASEPEPAVLSTEVVSGPQGPGAPGGDAGHARA